ncbi:MAG TPA: hypothetical protein DD441_06255 [Parabacteroides distasonis]|nr:hypothetical protein [Parabacteroides distasonis]
METKNFHFEDGANVRILPLMENETSWFVATDVCNLLGLDNSSRALERLDEDEKQKIDIECEGQVRKMWIINEFGLYSLILTSEKPKAKDFKRWVTHEVLPSIRKTGKYSTEDIKDRDEKIKALIKINDELKGENQRNDAQKKENEKTIKKNENIIKRMMQEDFRQMKLDF